MKAPFVSSKIAALLAVAGLSAAPAAFGQSATNPICPEEAVFYNPGDGEDIAVPRGFKVEVFARNLNFPTDIVFVGNRHDFRAFVLESGTGLPGRCNDNSAVPGVGRFSPANPFTPGLLVLDDRGRRIAGPLAKPTTSGGGLQPDGPAIGLAFEHGTSGGTLFATDSNQGVRGAPGDANNTSRIVRIGTSSGSVTPVITGL